MLNITKQVVQMHSTATEVGTEVDGKKRLAKILIKVNFNMNSERRRQAKVRSDRAREETQVERYARSGGCNETKPRNGDEDREICL
jgi:hypothetical protein